MADKGRLEAGPIGEKTEYGKIGEKRRSTGDDGPAAKKITMNFKSLKQDHLKSTSTESSGLEKKPVTSIKLSLNSQKPKETSHGLGIVKKSITVAQAFNSDSEDEEEEMPPEAKMRMKNVGRETPTAAGPNSFGKGKLGFSNHHRILEKDLLQQMEKEGD